MCPIACRQAPTWGSAVGVFAFDLCGSLPADDSAVVQAPSLAGKLPHRAVRLACLLLIYVGVCLQTTVRLFRPNRLQASSHIGQCGWRVCF